VGLSKTAGFDGVRTLLIMKDLEEKNPKYVAFTNAPELTMNHQATTATHRQMTTAMLAITDMEKIAHTDMVR
jgi:hypothetical protein